MARLRKPLAKPNGPTAGISGRLSNVFLPRLVGIGPDKLASVAKSNTELSACLYMSHVGRLLRRANPFRRFLRGPGKLAQQLARKISLLHVMKRRGYVRKHDGGIVKRDNS